MTPSRLVSQGEIEQICKREKPLRTIQLPPQSGPCMMQRGRLYELKSVKGGKGIVVTVVEAMARDDGGWTVRFVRGDEREWIRQDDPVYLRRRDGYTLSGAMAVRGEAEVLMPLAEDVEHARRLAREWRLAPQRMAVRAARGEIVKLKDAMATMKANNRVRRAVAEAEKLDRQLEKLETDDLSPTLDTG